MTRNFKDDLIMLQYVNYLLWNSKYDCIWPPIQTLSKRESKIEPIHTNMLTGVPITVGI